MIAGKNPIGTRRLRLHLGAHRTATTALQTVLQDNEALLSAASVSPLTRWRADSRTEQGMRRATHLLAQARRRSGLPRYLKIAKARRTLRKLISGISGDIVVLSDENLLGRPFLYEDGRAVYPLCEINLGLLARTLGRAPERVHVTVRDYASFLVSVYAMGVLYRAGAPRFETVKESLLRLDRRWPDVLRAVRAAFPGAEISFARYEGGSVGHALAALLSPEVDPALLNPSLPGVNRSPTLEAIEAALREQPQSVAEADALNLRFGEGTPFDPLTADEKARLSRLYEEDLQILAGEFREVR